MLLVLVFGAMSTADAAVFSAPVSPISPSTGPASTVAIGDLNTGDAFPDLLALGVRTGSVRLNDGTAVFSSGQALSASSAIAPSMALADLNGDGEVDVATTNANGMRLFARKGTRWFSGQSFNLDVLSRAVAIGDINGDGRPDLAVAGWRHDVGGGDLAAVTVFIRATPIGPGSTVGTEDYVQVPLQAPPGLPSGVAIADLDGDGDGDIAVALSTANAVGVYSKAGNGLSAADYTLQTVATPAGVQPVAVAMGDLNGDGRSDLATADSNLGVDGSVSVFFKNAGGGFMLARSLTTAAGNAKTSAVALGDLDGDGRLDIVAANTNDGGGSVSVFLKDATGDGFTNTTIAAGQQPASVAIGDLFGQGKLDIVIGGSVEASVLRNTTPQATSFVLDGPAGSVFGDPVSFSTSTQRVVVGLRGASAVGGTVTYTVDGRVLAPVALPGSGLVPLSTSASGVGMHPVKAEYSGDANYAARSATRTQVVTAATTVGPGEHAGALTVSGSTFVTGAHITGDVTVQAGATLDMENSTIDGDVTAVGAGAIRMCGTRVNGSVSITGSTGLVVVGDIEHANCDVNTITGDLAFKDNTHGVMSIADSVGGDVSSVNNSGPGPFPGDVTTIAQSMPRPVARLSGNDGAFDDTTIGQTSEPVSVTVTNVGLAALHVSGTSVTGADESQFEVLVGGGCDVPVAPEAQCTVDVVFKPTSRGAKTAVLEVASDTPSSPSTVALSGKGLLAPILDLSVLGAAFANTLVGSVSASQAISVSNDGETPLQVTAIAFDGPGAGQFTVDPGACAGALLAAGAACSVSVAFAPTVAGVQSADLAFSSNAASSPDTVTVSGTAIAPVTPPPPPDVVPPAPPPSPPPPVTPKAPSNVVRLSKVTAAAKGLITVLVRVPGAGRLSVSSKTKLRATPKKAKARTATYGRVVSATAKRASTVTLRIRPGAVTAVALRRAKRLAVTVTVAFTPAGGKRANKTTHTTARIR